MGRALLLLLCQQVSDTRSRTEISPCGSGLCCLRPYRPRATTDIRAAPCCGQDGTDICFGLPRWIDDAERSTTWIRALLLKSSLLLENPQG